MTPEDQARVAELSAYRDALRSELHFRQLSGRTYKWADEPTADLEAAEKWVVAQIEKVIEPYERGMA